MYFWRMLDVPVMSIAMILLLNAILSVLRNLLSVTQGFSFPFSWPLVVWKKNVHTLFPLSYLCHNISSEYIHLECVHILGLVHFSVLVAHDFDVWWIIFPRLLCCFPHCKFSRVFSVLWFWWFLSDCPSEMVWDSFVRCPFQLHICWQQW